MREHVDAGQQTSQLRTVTHLSKQTDPPAEALTLFSEPSLKRPAASYNQSVIP
jgi:hypothetical protein